MYLLFYDELFCLNYNTRLCRPIKASGDIAGPVERVKIEDMFGKCWSIPNPGPPLPTIITVQAPAGIGHFTTI